MVKAISYPASIIYTVTHTSLFKYTEKIISGAVHVAKEKVVKTTSNCFRTLLLYTWIFIFHLYDFVNIFYYKLAYKCGSSRRSIAIY